MSVIASMAMVYVGCCSNVVFLELLVTENPSSGNIITFSQFLFIALFGFIFTTKFGTVPRKIPLRHYITLTVMFFLVNVTNNYALNFNISMPLHMIFRSGSLLANMVMGIIILKRRYSLQKYLSVFAITVGIVISTIASGKQVSSDDDESGDDATSYAFFRWVTGVALLTFALFLSARMGIYQETLYTTYGKHPNEALFYSHALPLPGFLLLSSDLLSQVGMFNTSAPIAGVPCMWLYLIGNFLTQYVCISSVYKLTSVCASLTVTLVITLRKFISLLFSILYFGNPFTFTHWIGTVLVFGGTLLFAEVPQMLLGKQKKKD